MFERVTPQRIITRHIEVENIYLLPKKHIPFAKERYRFPEKRNIG